MIPRPIRRKRLRETAAICAVVGSFVAVFAAPLMGPQWQPIETAPEDTPVILATSGGWHGEAYMLINQETEEREWFWAGHGSDGKPLRADQRFKPFSWQPMPDHPDPTLDNEISPPPEPEA